MKKPDFIGVGAPRTGTTWLFEMLKSHPDVDLPNQKSINFFNSNYEKGTNWYHEHFKNLKGEVLGEISPLYFGHEHVAKRIFETVPDAKILIIVRNPNERLISHVNLINTLRAERKTAQERINLNPNLIEYGMYSKYTELFLNYFPQNQVLLIEYSQIKKNPEIVYKTVAEFLGVNHDFLPNRLNQKIGYNIQPKFKLIETLRKRLFSGLIKMNLSKIIWLVKKSGLTNRLRSLNNTKNENLDDTSKSLILQDKMFIEQADFYKNDSLNFQKKFGINLKENKEE